MFNKIDNRPLDEQHASKRGAHLLNRFHTALSDQAMEDLTEKQKQEINNAILSLSIPEHHSINIKSSISIFKKRYYYSFLFGKDNREDNESSLLGLIVFLLTLFLLISSATIGLFIIVYLIKSAAGIDIFDHYSLGLWDWFKTKILHSV
ncbi:hypothetical protein [Vibrio hannami]|uniref:hypothetical protein n=1 Tax=Vibrio hannami TaxID=2717094 RepID=UPI003EBF7C78